MVVEILDTVRISTRSHVLATESVPGDRLDCVDRMLVISLELATLTKPGAWSTEGGR